LVLYNGIAVDWDISTRLSDGVCYMYTAAGVRLRTAGNGGDQCRLKGPWGSGERLYFSFLLLLHWLVSVEGAG